MKQCFVNCFFPKKLGTGSKEMWVITRNLPLVTAAHCSSTLALILRLIVSFERDVMRKCLEKLKVLRKY